MNVLQHNRDAWNAEVAKGNEWTQPVSADTIARARRGDWQIVLTPVKPVPHSWFLPLSGLRVLALAASGGQQAPVLAAAGAVVTVVDNSPAQLAQDRTVADRESLSLTLIEGDMANLDSLADASFDLIFHPVSNCFVPAVRPVWHEAYRVLRPGGVLLAGFCNPVSFLFDGKAADRGELVLRHSIPYSDLTSLPEAELRAITAAKETLSFGHTLEDQIGGQLDAGFVIDKMYEDKYAPDANDPVSKLIPTFMATRAVRPL